jgi:hypothetical protein
MLVHMAPQEVASLNALARANGGTLSTNPDTGLPEAGFLGSILPMVIGAALTPLTGGLINPMTAGLLVGGGTALATGNLQKGLMAGLGAYGGAGLMGGITGAGQAAAASELAAQGSGAASAMGAGANAKDILLARGAAPVGTAMQALNTSPVMAGAQAAFNDPMSAVNAMGGNKQALRYGLSAAAPVLLGGGAPTKAYDGGGPNPYEYTFDYETGQYTRVPVGTREDFKLTPNVPMQRAEGGPVQAMSDRNEQEMFVANGGQMYAFGGLTEIIRHIEEMNRNPYEYTYGPDGKFTQVPVGTRQAMFEGRPAQAAPATQTAPAAPDAASPAMAAGGISHLGDYSDGGRLLRGPGDGVSDSIPAVIGSKRPARLADGEFVVPARVVSELGNGSTEAGARKLYAMMDRVQRARGKTVGKGKVAANTRADKYLPA